MQPPAAGLSAPPMTARRTGEDTAADFAWLFAEAASPRGGTGIISETLAEASV